VVFLEVLSHIMMFTTSTPRPIRCHCVYDTPVNSLLRIDIYCVHAWIFSFRACLQPPCLGSQESSNPVVLDWENFLRNHHRRIMLRSSNSRLRSLIRYFITLRTKHLRSSLDSCSCRISSTKGVQVASMNIIYAYDSLASNSACMKQPSLSGARPRGVS